MLKITVSACIMAIAVYGLVQLISGMIPGMIGKLILLIVPTAAGVGIFFALTALLRMEELNFIKDLFRKVLKRG